MLVGRRVAVNDVSQATANRDAPSPSLIRLVGGRRPKGGGGLRPCGQRLIFVSGGWSGLSSITRAGTWSIGSGSALDVELGVLLDDLCILDVMTRNELGLTWCAASPPAWPGK
jgi:hypothetical protein